MRVAAVDGRLLGDVLQEDARVAGWSGVLYVPEHGLYEFAVQAPAGATLDLDGQTVVVPADEGERTVSLGLAQGNHSLRIRTLGRPGQVRLLWQPPEQETLGAIPLQYVWPSRASAPQSVLIEPAAPLSVAGLGGRRDYDLQWGKARTIA
jgi:hypothetical protein